MESTLRSWPTDHVVKAMVYAGSGEDEHTRTVQERRLRRLAQACHSQDREFLVELQAPPGTAYDDRGVAPFVDWMYSLGVRPDWWKLPPSGDPAVWTAVGDLIRSHDPYCRGVLVLGQTSGGDVISAALAAAAAEPMVKGFAVGRGIFAESARRWLAGDLDDGAFVDIVAGSYAAYIETWRAAKDLL